MIQQVEWNPDERGLGTERSVHLLARRVESSPPRSRDVVSELVELLAMPSFRDLRILVVVNIVSTGSERGIQVGMRSEEIEGNRGDDGGLTGAGGSACRRGEVVRGVEEELLDGSTVFRRACKATICRSSELIEKEAPRLVFLQLTAPDHLFNNMAEIAPIPGLDKKTTTPAITKVSRRFFSPPRD